MSRRRRMEPPGNQGGWLGPLLLTAAVVVVVTQDRDTVTTELTALAIQMLEAIAGTQNVPT